MFNLAKVVDVAFPADQISWASECVIEYVIFLHASSAVEDATKQNLAIDRLPSG